MLKVTARRTLLAHLRYNGTKTYLRCQSTYSIDPSVQQVASGLAKYHPAFAVSSSRIAILNEPTKFLALLLDMIQRAEHRIFISSLYIGSAESSLIDALRSTLAEKPNLQLSLQLDLNRSTRPGASSTAKILLPLKEEFPERVNISFFKSPSLRGILAKLVPPRFNEGWGTWHAKIYGVDDEVIISGANLNKSYFTNRQDRYIHFSAQPQVAQYCFDFLRTVSTFSYSLLPASQNLSPHSYHHEGYTLTWPDPHTHPHEIHGKAETAFSALQSSQRTLYNLQPSADKKHLVSQHDSTDPDNVLLFPVIQAGQFNIREEEAALALLFRNLHSTHSSDNSSHPLVDLTSGYFGLYQVYQDLILKNDVDTRIVASSPKANGFYGSKGISGRIPEGYTLLEQRFMRAVKRAGRLWNKTVEEGGEGGVQLSEWERDGWTYHAKGIWVSPDHSSPPVLTLFGSTNLNSRSAHIDTELSFIMIIPSTQNIAGAKNENGGAINDAIVSTISLRHQLADEISQLRAYTTNWKGAQRHVRLWTKIIVQFVKGML